MQSNKSEKTQKNIRELQKIRKNIRIKIRTTTDACEKRIFKDRTTRFKYQGIQFLGMMAQTTAEIF